MADWQHFGARRQQDKLIVIVLAGDTYTETLEHTIPTGTTAT